MANMILNSRRYDPIPDSSDLGKSMSAITPQQRAFVLAYIESGTANASQAARAAGYGEASDTEERAKAAAKVSGFRLIHDPKILAALKELAQDHMSANAFKAANVLVEIAEDPTHKDRLKAAELLMNRSGMLVVNQSEVVHVHKLEKRSDILERIEVIAKRNGLDPAALIAGRLPAPVQPDTVDAEFEEVAVPSADGLEDLL